METKADKLKLQLELSKVIAAQPNCKHRCFLKEHTLPQATEIILACLQETEGLSWKQKKNYIRYLFSFSCNIFLILMLFLIIYRAKIGSSCVSKSGFNNLKMNWTIGYGSFIIRGVCRHCFMSAYCLKHSIVDQLVADVKKGIVNSAGSFSDRTSSIGGRLQTSVEIAGATNLITNFASLNNTPLNTRQIGALNVPNSAASLMMYSWMEFYFNLIGDQEPNTDGEIHLEPVRVKEIYQEYCNDLVLGGYKALSESQFGNMWLRCFRFVLFYF